jgi:hypothetical protein
MSSDATMISFGDVFRYRGEVYVYLATFDGVVHTAKILSKEDSNLILSAHDKKALVGRPEKRGNVLYCYVVLSTSEFKDRLAHLLHYDKRGIEPSFESFIDRMGRLGAQDIVDLKNEIMTASVVTGQLREHVKQLQV